MSNAKTKRGRPRKSQGTDLSDDTKYNTNRNNVEDIMMIANGKVKYESLGGNTIVQLQFEHEFVENLHKYVSTIEKFIPNVYLIFTNTGLTITNNFVQDSFVNVCRLFISNFADYKIAKKTIVPIDTKKLLKTLKIVYDQGVGGTLEASDVNIIFNFSSRGLERYIAVEYFNDTQDIDNSVSTILNKATMKGLETNAIFMVNSKEFHDVIKSTENIAPEGQVTYQQDKISIISNKSGNLMQYVSFCGEKIRFLKETKIPCEVKYNTKSLTKYTKLHTCSSLAKLYVYENAIKIEYDFGDVNNLGIINISFCHS